MLREPSHIPLKYTRNGSCVIFPHRSIRLLEALSQDYSGCYSSKKCGVDSAVYFIEIILEVYVCC